MKHRSFLLLWVGKLISTAGSALTTLAASILVYRLTGSALSVGLMLIATVLPSIAIGLFAGVLVDRFDRKKIMLVSDLLRALLSFLIPFMVVQNQLWLYAIVMLSSTVGQFFNPAEESILPEIVGEKELSAANSLMAISGFASAAAGFALCGWITSRFPLQWAFYLDALSFLFSMLCIWQIPILELRSYDRSNFHTIIEDLRSGRRYMQENARLCSLICVTIPAFLAFGLWNSLLLPFTLHMLHGSSFDYGIQEGLTSVGFVAGSLTVMKLGGRIKEGQWIILSFLGMGVVGVSYALSADIPLAIVLVAITGLLNAPYSVARRLVIQRNTTTEIRGRINSIFFVVRDIAYVAGMATAGLADSVSIRSLIVVSALLWVATGMWSLWKFGSGGRLSWIPQAVGAQMSLEIGLGLESHQNYVSIIETASDRFLGCEDSSWLILPGPFNGSSEQCLRCRPPSVGYGELSAGYGHARCNGITVASKGMESAAGSPARRQNSGAGPNTICRIQSPACT
jgi:DHA3 family macrolide efflux protein-like MFS transporter